MTAERAAPETGRLAAETTPAVPLKPSSRKALARADLVKHYIEAIAARCRGEKTAAREDFMSAYNSGISHPLIYGILGPVSWKTIERWKSGGSDLADRRGAWRRGRHGLSAEEEAIVLKCACHPNAPRISESIRLARAVMESRGIANGHSEQTYRRFIADWKSRNQHLWVMNREGEKPWNDTCASYIERDYDKIAVGDILVADGHVLNFEVVNPFTGRAGRMTLILWYDMKSNFPLGWELMPTENTAAIAAALRRAILRLGKIPRVAYLDNGKAFAARFFNGIDLTQAGVYGLFARLGIFTIFAWPYHGQSKPVERFFGSFAELERLCPTYVGTSIENKPPRLNRGEKLHRRVYEKATGGAGLTLTAAHQAIAAWFDIYAARPQRGHLKGATPMEVFLAGRGPGVDRAELIYLMMGEIGRTINRNGVSFLGRNYYDAALYGRRHEVTVRYDVQDQSCVYVFDGRDDSFICEAKPVDKIHPAAFVLGTEEDRAALVTGIKRYQEQKRQASASAREFLNQEVMPEHKRMLASMGVENGPPPRAETPKALPMSAAEEKQIEADVRKLREMQAELPPEQVGFADECLPESVDDAAELRMQLNRMDEADRYEALMDMDVQGLLVTNEWRAFMTYFELTPAYERHRGYFEERRLKMAAAFGRRPG